MSDVGNQYAFGDTPVARERLELLGTVFDAPSRAFLGRAVPERPALAVDLGCGPGATTRLVHETTGARRTAGLDSSPGFVAAARESAPDGVDFQVWQAGEPLPVDGPDLIYARLLLAHLPRPVDLVAQWASQLRAGGRLLVDEVERIETDSDVFTEYLAMSDAIVRSRGAEMFAGPLLTGFPLAGDCRELENAIAVLPVRPADAARMFALNLAVWGGSPWAIATYGSREIARVANGLRSIADRAAGGAWADGASAGGAPAAGITWHMRQVVVARS